MQNVKINNQTFYYQDSMVYFYDQQDNTLLFMLTIPTDDTITAYDDPQLIIEFSGSDVTFTPLWNIEVKQLGPNEYILEEPDD